jgi:hypothetical protein
MKVRAGVILNRTGLLVSVPPIKPSVPSPPPDLETRIANRKHELIAEIVENKNNSSRAGAAEAIDRAKTRLSELAGIVKEHVVDGWANLGPSTKLKLEEWMAR